MNPSISLSISVLFKLLVPEGNSRCFKILSLRLIDVLFCLFSKLFWTLSLLIGVGVGEGVGEGVGWVRVWVWVWVRVGVGWGWGWGWG